MVSYSIVYTKTFIHINIYAIPPYTYIGLKKKTHNNREFWNSRYAQIYAMSDDYMGEYKHSFLFIIIYIICVSVYIVFEIPSSHIYNCICVEVYI